MLTFNPRHSRQAFIYSPLPTSLSPRRRAPFICSATPPSHPTTATSPEDQFAQRLAASRERSRQLHLRLLNRLANAAIVEAESTLSTANSESPRNLSSVTRRLRRELRSLRISTDASLNSSTTSASTSVATPDDASTSAMWVSIARLQSLIEDLERKEDSDSAFARERLQEQLEGPTRPVEDVMEFDDESTTASSTTRGVAPLNVLRRRGESWRRTVSGVGDAIEGTVAEFVRDDGSIDVDGLRGWVRRLLDSIAMTWMRLNGRAPSTDIAIERSKGSTVDIPSPQPLVLRDERKEFLLREEIGLLEKKLIETSKKRENTLRREDQLGKLIRAKSLRQMDDEVNALRRTLAVRVLQLELEKVFVCLAEEIDAAAYDVILEQRVLVVEFGEIDERLATIDIFVEQEEPLLIEDDTLGELAADIQDMKLRLGIDAPLYSSATLSWTQVGQFMMASSQKARDGAEFYIRGLRLFAGDARFAMRLVRRAILGYTPTPREIRTLRRTGRDLLTLIPFTIVLIAPLTPVGHVLIFSFLQRYWPEFFPSTFSERRQAMMKRHEQYMKVLDVDEESKDGDNEGAVTDDKTSGAGNENMLRTMKKMVRNARGKEDDKDNSKRQEEQDINEVNKDELEDEEEHPVELNDLAESVRSSEALARRRRSVVALDELHLAD